MKNFVIYTVMVGGYDEIRQPLVVDDRFDYVLFSDQHIGETIGVWKVRSIQCEIDSTDPKISSRFPKCNPELVFVDYKASLYIDANLQIMDHFVYNRCVELYDNNCLWAGVKHPDRDCVYEEAYTMTLWQFEYGYKAFGWIHFLRKNNFQRHFGLLENNMIYRRHCEMVRRVNQLWWQLFLRYSTRDQFTLMYALKKNDISPEYFFSKNEDTHNSSHMQFYNHREAVKYKLVPMDYWDTLRERIHRLNPNIIKRYFYTVSIFGGTKWMLNTWTFILGFVFSPILLYKIIAHKIAKL